MRAVEKSEGGPVRDSIYSDVVAYWRGTFPGRRDARRRGAGVNSRTATHTPCRSSRERFEKSCWCTNELQAFFLLRFARRSANKGSNSADFQRCSRSRPPRSRRQKGKERAKKKGKRSRPARSILKCVRRPSCCLANKRGQILRSKAPTVNPCRLASSFFLLQGKAPEAVGAPCRRGGKPGEFQRAPEIRRKNSRSF